MESDETSRIYCRGGEGTILHAVQMQEIFEDSKTFVDMKLRNSPDIVLENFTKLNQSSSHLTKENVARFVEDNFCHEEDLAEVHPADWEENPANLLSIGNLEIKQFCLQLNRRWKLLGRQLGGEIGEFPHLTSLLPLPHTVIVPGGRFGEVYYWDTYWILRGLLVCNMRETARGVIQNLLFLVARLGFVPNGGRRYFTRSQPPLLSAMVFDYYTQFEDKEWALGQIYLLEKEWTYWETNHAVLVEGRTLFRYCCCEGEPRPESYREDMRLADHLQSHQRPGLFQELRSAAESGWDFSSRWFQPSPTQPATLPKLATTKIKNIVPADLNAFLAQAAGIIAGFHSLSGNLEAAAIWETKRTDLVSAMEAVLWCEEEGVWLDYNIQTGEQRHQFSLSNLVPLWAGAVPNNELERRGALAARYLAKHGVVELEEAAGNHTVSCKLAGIPTTMTESGEQWDYPNVWPPLEHMVVFGLINSGDKLAKSVGEQLGKTAVDRNLKIFNSRGHMFEKYDCRGSDCVGSGGEYSVQLGFGWTNGATLDIVNTLKYMWN